MPCAVSLKTAFHFYTPKLRICIRPLWRVTLLPHLPLISPRFSNFAQLPQVSHSSSLSRKKKFQPQSNPKAHLAVDNAEECRLRNLNLLQTAKLESPWTGGYQSHHPNHPEYPMWPVGMRTVRSWSVPHATPFCTFDHLHPNQNKKIS